MNIRPEDFSTDTPPVRTIGLECEYNLQVSPDSDKGGYDFVSPVALNGSGVANHGGYLGEAHGAGRVYPDVGHLEFDTRESPGPAAAAVEDIEGIARIADVVTRTGYAHDGLYRLAGTYVQNGRVESFTGQTDRSSAGRTSGYHENYLIPRAVSTDSLIDALLPTVLATRVWGMSGTLRREGFVFGQKVWGNGGNPVERTLARRTTHGEKPMVIIPPIISDQDTIGSDSWARAEVRMADPGLSIVNRYLSFAEVSLALRLVELQRIVGRTAIERICLADPVHAAKRFGGDLSLQAVAVVGEKTTTWLDTQEQLLDLFEVLNEKVQLPEDEKLAIVAIRSLLTALRQSKPAHAEYANLVRLRTDFAPRHQFISHGKNQTAINAYSHEAMQRNLLWDRVLPAGNGYRYWAGMSAKDPLARQVRLLAEQSGKTRRSVVRALIIDKDTNGSQVLNWSRYRDPTGTVRSLGDPA